MPKISEGTTIYSGGSDLVTLDTASSVRSLTLGGRPNGTSSTLTESGFAESLTIANSLVVGQTGFSESVWRLIDHGGRIFSNAGIIDLSNGSSLSVTGNLDNNATLQTLGGSATINVSGTLTNNAVFNLGGSGDVANVGSIVNNDAVLVAAGANLNLTNQPGGISDIPADTYFRVQGSVNDTLDSTNGFYHLSSIEGALFMQNGKTTDITPQGGPLMLSNIGNLDAGNNSTINIHGAVDNSGFVFTGRFYYDSTSSIINAGNFTNKLGASLPLYDSGDNVVVNTLTNRGYVFVGAGAELDMLKQPGAIADIPYGSEFQVQGTFADIIDGRNGSITCKASKALYCCRRILISRVSTHRLPSAAPASLTWVTTLDSSLAAASITRASSPPAGTITTRSAVR